MLVFSTRRERVLRHESREFEQEGQAKAVEELSERKKKILRAVVESYVANAEPVGSKALTSQPELKVSSATIRNEMSDLEDMGLLEQPHTSAGRIPSAKGYRYYVNELMDEHRLSIEETNRINDALRGKLQELDRVIASAGQVVSQLTKYPAFSMKSAAQRVTIKRFDVLKVEDNAFIIVVLTSASQVKNRMVRLPQQLTDEQLSAVNTLLNRFFAGRALEEITPELMGLAQNAAGGSQGLLSLAVSFAYDVLEDAERQQISTFGVPNILAQPEFKDMEKAAPFMEYLSNTQESGNFPVPKGQDKKQILIGPENVAEELKNSSVIMARYDIGEGMQGVIGVVGPTRMDYAKLAARMEYFANTMSRMFGQTELPEGEENK